MFYIRIIDLNEHFCNLTEENNLINATVHAGQNMKWNIIVKGHPEPRLSWWNNKNVAIPKGTSAHYKAVYTAENTILEIYQVSIEDFGKYTLKAENKFANESIVLFLNVTDKPSAQIESEHYYMIGTEAQITCKVRANPRPYIDWSVKHCEDENCNFTKV